MMLSWQSLSIWFWKYHPKCIRLWKYEFQFTVSLQMTWHVIFRWIHTVWGQDNVIDNQKFPEINFMVKCQFVEKIVPRGSSEDQDF